MNDQAKRIQIIINTLQDLDIKSTFENMNRLMGVLQELAKIRDELNNQGGEILELSSEDEKIGEIKVDGNADTE